MAFVKTRPKPFAGTGVHKQQVALTLQTLCGCCARDSYSFTYTHTHIHTCIHTHTHTHTYTHAYTHTYTHAPE